MHSPRSESDPILASRRSYAAGLLFAGLAEQDWMPGGLDAATIAVEGLALGGAAVVSPAELDAVFASATLARERRTGRYDGLGRFDESAIAWDVAEPWIDRRVQDLARRLAPQPGRRSARKFRVIVTHDLDRTTGFEPTAMLNALLKAGGIRRSACLGLRDAFSPGALLRNVARLVETERAHGVGAIYFMMAGPYGWGRYATRTDIRWNVSRQVARLVRQGGMTVGLHGSFQACERDSYAEEKDRVEQVLGAPIRAHRSHYLRFDPRRLPSQLEAAGIQSDFSVGFSQRIGFRGGYAAACRSYDLVRERPAAVISVPLLFMDTLLLGRDPAEILPDLRKALETTREVNGCVSLLFHPELFLVDPRFFDLFESVLRLCRELGADLSGQWPSLSSTPASKCPQ